MMLRTLLVLSSACGAAALRPPHTTNTASAPSRRAAIFGASAALMIPATARASPGVLNVGALKNQEGAHLVEPLPLSGRTTALLGEVDDTNDFPSSLIASVATEILNEKEIVLAFVGLAAVALLGPQERPSAPAPPKASPVMLDLPIE